MAAISAKVEVSFSWWWRWFYLPGLVTVSLVTGLEPDWDKVQAVAERAAKVKVTI